MGSWSVYCGISQIAITAGMECVLLPLKENKSGDSYIPYLPATLPIFGKYDDYGGLEEIEEDENTKLIEKHFKCSIEDFCTYFTRGCIRDDEDDFPVKLKKNKEIKGCKFMFIERKVYEFMSTHTSKEYSGAGHFDFGDPGILKLLGFTYEGESEDPKINPCNEPTRYKQIWSLGDKKLYSDGRWVSTGKSGESIYTFNGSYNSLKDFLGEIPEDKKWIGEKTMWQLHEYLNESSVNEKLNWIIGGKKNHYVSVFDTLTDKEAAELYSLLGKTDDVSRKRMEELTAIAKKRKPAKPIAQKYTEGIPYFNKLLCDLVTIRYNLYCMSGYFAPYVLHLTPQCGEHRDHQYLLEKFAEINKAIVAECGYDDDEEDEDDE
jgi:hypothetical protein